MTLQIGYAQSIITPDLSRPVYLAGFERNRRAEQIHDDLFARAMAVISGDHTLVLVALDLIGLGRMICLEIGQKLAEIHPGTQIVIASTHTHHGPDTIGLWGPNLLTSGIDPIYMEKLKECILTAAQAAISNRQPALMKVAAVPVPGVVKNARNPEIVDEELTCVQFVDPAEGVPLLTLVNFPCHPETLFPANTSITADYPHYLRESIEYETTAPCIFFSGALGGMMTPDVVEHSFGEAEANGQKLAQAGLAALEGCRPVDPGTFEYRQIEYRIPLKSLLLEQALRAGLVKGAIQTKDHGKRAIQSEASLLKLGPAWFVMVPGELLPGPGLQVKDQLRQAGAAVPGIIGLANDELGYILPDEDYIYPKNPFEPGDHYEETMSIGPTAGSALMRAIQDII